MLVRKAEILVYLGQAASITDADEALLDLLHPLVESAVRLYLQNDLGYAQHVELYPAGRAFNNDDVPLDDAEFRDGAVVFVNETPGSRSLVLKHTPVWSAGLEVREDVAANAGQAENAFGENSILTAGQDYWLDVDDAATGVSRTGILYRFGVWPNEPRSVRVVYYGGTGAAKLADEWNVIKEAVLETVAAKFWGAKTNATSKGNGPYQSESIGKWSASYGNAATSLAAQGQAADLPHGAKMKLFRLRNVRYL